MHNKIAGYILNCFDNIIVKYNLTVTKKPLGTFGFSIELENEIDFLTITYSTHPSDFPFSIDVRYCKQKFIDKKFVLYATDTTEITSIWEFDKELNTTITGSFRKDMPIIFECCKRATEMFIYFQAMSDESYYEISTSKGFSKE